MGQTCEVAVIGLGAMGAAVLFQLARRGVEAIGIDRYASPHAFGSSHGETRITRCAVGEGEAYVPLALASHRIWRELEERTGLTLLEACGCLVVGSASGAAVHHGKTDFVGRSIRAAQANGIAHEVLDGAEAMRRFPQIAGADGARAYFEPGGGFVYPEACIAAQLDAARDCGARTSQADVRAIRETGRGVDIHLDGETIAADRAVIAAGAWTPALAGSPFDRLLTVNRQVLHWFPVDGETYAPGRFPTIIWMHGNAAENYFYGFPAVPGTGLLKAATEQYVDATTPEALVRTVAANESRLMFRQHLSSRLKGVGATAVKAAVCVYTVTPDSGFIVDRHPGMERVTVISACSGHGFKHSAGIGERVAAHIAEDVPLPPAFGLERFAALTAE